MQASAWKVVCEALHELEEQGVDDKKIKDELGLSRNLRARYLVLYDMVSHLANANQVKVSVLATTTGKS
jgi:orotate phosphoribosyltransferase-like protein